MSAASASMPESLTRLVGAVQAAALRVEITRMVVQTAHRPGYGERELRAGTKTGTSRNDFRDFYVVATVDRASNSKMA